MAPGGLHTMRKALVTGITGQDGAYLAEFLLKKGYEVHGIKRRSSLFNTQRIDHLYQDPHSEHPRLVLHYGDLTDTSSLVSTIQKIQPDEIYNLAAQSHVMVSFEEPEYTANADALGALRVLEAIRLLGPGQEDPFLPGLDLGDVRPGAGDAAVRDDALLSAFAVRRGQGLRLLDHGELSRVLRDVRLQRHPLQSRVAHPRRDVCDPQDYARTDPDQGGDAGLPLPGQTWTPLRDWGHARDYVEAQWLMLQQETARDYVIASGEQHSVREFVDLAAARAGDAPGPGAARASRKQAVDERGETVVRVDPRYFRPSEVETLLGNPEKARRELGWTPRTTFQ
jgi:GDPmannose 4,6-dehydratase